MSATENQWLDDENLARSIVRQGLSVLDGNKTVVVEQIGALSVLSKAEQQELHAFRDRMDAYWELSKPEHPLCLGVFGPPGSGKSFAVKQLLKELQKRLLSGTAKKKQPVFRTINLAQLAGPAELSSALAEVVRWSIDQMPVIFFDEFDSRLAGTSLGWLQWLLAPMQDGVIIDHGHSIELKQAVFVFAGGTADTFEEFPEAHEGYFRGAKGTDFVSRLRGHLNIRGPNNGPYRRVRRAVVLRLAIERVASGLLEDNCLTEARLKDSLLDQVLAVGRFRHGARSVEALVEMATKPGQKEFKLPGPDVLASHVDSGPLGRLVIALSAGGRQGDYEAKLDEIWPIVATRLLELGAALVYGGELGGFTKRLLDAKARLPDSLFSDKDANDDYRMRPRAGRVRWVHASTSGEDAPTSPDPTRIDPRKMPGLSDEEFAELDLPLETNLREFKNEAESVANWRDSLDCRKRLGNSLALFRMRALVARFADAHLLFGGKEQGSSGRFPGIAEEVMLNLANRRPIYVCGGFGGAARSVGQVLGLDEPWTTRPASLQLDTHGPQAALLETAVQDWDWRFQLPHRHDLPLTYESLVSFLRSHALEGPNWPDNGLTAEENRLLFRSTDPEEIVRLVTKGLRRVGEE